VVTVTILSALLIPALLASLAGGVIKAWMLLIRVPG
jgi:hypothetical protein